MSCEYCFREIGHDLRCPNYTPLKTSHYCSICSEGICNGEEYVTNTNQEYAHYDCLYNMTMHRLIEWFDGEIKTMEEENGEYY